MKNFGVEHLMQSKEIQKVNRERNLEKYGVEFVSQIETTKIKCKNTCLQNYGVDNPSKSNLIKEKKIETCKRNHSVDYPMQSKEVRYKRKKTMIDKYSVEYPIQNKDIRNRMKKTNLEKYGVENANQNLEIHNKSIQTALLVKKYKDTDIFYQGSYELDFLNNFYGQFEIKRNFFVSYKYYNDEKMYFPDFYLPEYNLIVEIKSDYTYEKEKDKNMCKRKSCIEQGYKFIFIINKNYEKFIQLIEHQKSALK